MTSRRSTVRRWGAASAALALGCGVLTAANVPPAIAGATFGVQRAGAASSLLVPGKPAVIGKRVIGKSVNGHPIRAWELGEKDAPVTAVVFGRHHGNEPAGQIVLDTLRDGNAVHGIDLWVVPRLNPDGALRNTRQNARGVDLNRNFPWRWKRLERLLLLGSAPSLRARDSDCDEVHGQHRP